MGTFNLKSYTKWYKIHRELRALNYKIKKFNIDNDLSVCLTVGKRYPTMFQKDCRLSMEKDQL